MHLILKTMKSTVTYGGYNAMEYWNKVSREVKETLAERPTADQYDNAGLLARWVRNLSETGRGVICSVDGVRSAHHCDGI